MHWKLIFCVSNVHPNAKIGAHIKKYEPNKTKVPFRFLLLIFQSPTFQRSLPSLNTSRRQEQMKAFFTLKTSFDGFYTLFVTDLEK